jgi:hypothetical protein
MKSLRAPHFSRLRVIASFAFAVYSVLAHAAEPIRLHPQNGHYFLFRNRPTVLVGSSEHYGAVVNLDFDYIRYLDEIRACGLNLVRVFAGGYRETPGAFQISDNTLVPLPGRSVLPWARTTEPGAADGGNKFDLNKWNPAFFYRLRDFVKAAGERDIVVEVTYFCPLYDDSLWNIYPMKSTNHVNGAGAGGRVACFQSTSDLVPFQKALIRKCATELRDFDNVYHEIINEPYASGVPAAWQNLMIAELVDAESTFPHRHLIAQNVANGDAAITNPHSAVSIFNFHYALPDAALRNLGLNRAIGDDETGFAEGGVQMDFPYRREAWEFMLCGGGIFNHLDFSFTASREDGVALSPAPGGGGPAIRRELGVLRWFLEDMPLLRVTPQTNFVVSGTPTGGAVRVLGVPGEVYGIYVRGGTQANLTVNAPAGDYQGQWINPQSGQFMGAENFTHTGGHRILVTPNYTEDIALKLSAGPAPHATIEFTSPNYNALIPSNRPHLELTAAPTITGGTVKKVEFFKNSKSLNIVTEPPFTYKLTTFEPGAHLLHATVTAMDGRVANSLPLKITVTGPFQSGVNLNGSRLLVDGETWHSEAEAIASGLTISNSTTTSSAPNITYYPSPDGPTQLVLASQLSLTATAANGELRFGYPLSSGCYDVFLYVVEGQGSYSRDMRFEMEGQTVAIGLGNQALGEWHKYGPYRTTVEDGILDIGLKRETKGSPKIAGFALYQADPPVSASKANLQIVGHPELMVLSYPPSVPATIVEVSDSLEDEGSWVPLDLPAAESGAVMIVTVPIEGKSSRFFRLRSK